jgi:nicotinamide phosphoribosyltransferase
MSKKFAPFQKDSYKVGHKDQYPDGTTKIYSNFTARSGNRSNVPGSTGVRFVGLQYYILNYLIEEWDESFFNRDKYSVTEKYRRMMENMGTPVDVKHIETLHDLGYLPIEIKALPEGSFVPYGVPMLTITNTLPDFYWVTNMLETSLSCELWLPITSATIYDAYRRNSEQFAELTCEDDSLVPYQNHDFSMRGMQNRFAAATSGFASLAMGSLGTDCVPALELAENYYGVEGGYIGGSIHGTEHSVMCAGGQDDEIGTLKRLITEVYPEGPVAAVCDSWDFWKLVTEYLPELKSVIMGRDGKLVIRPDSGDPVAIICGTGEDDTPEGKGLIECLWDTFGGRVNAKGYKELDPHIGAIYGDSITLARQWDILDLLRRKGFASNNIVFGVGSYTYSFVTRDTHGIAMKSTYAEINGKGVAIFKDPKTDDGTKKSAKGLLMVTKVGDVYKLVDNVSVDQERHGCLETVFLNGSLVKKTTIHEIRDVVKNSPTITYNTKGALR